MKSKIIIGISFVITLLIFTTVPPVIINELYRRETFYITEWGANEVFVFYGAVLTFIGSLFLGGVATFQNNKLSVLNERMLRIEENKNCPYIEITTSDMKQQSIWNDTNEKIQFDIGKEVMINPTRWVKVVIRNKKDITINKVILKKVSIECDNKIKEYKDVSKYNEHIYLSANSCKSAVVNIYDDEFIDRDKVINFKITFNFVLYTINGEKFNEIMETEYLENQYTTCRIVDLIIKNISVKGANINE